MPGICRRLVGKQPVLNLARDFQVALHHHAVAHFEEQNEQQDQAAVETEIEIEDVVSGLVVPVRTPD